MFAMFAAFNSGQFNVGDNLSFYLQENNLHYLMLALAGIPVLMCAIGFLLLSIKIFAPKSKFNYVWPFMGLLGIIWLAVIGIFSYSAISVESQYEGHNEETENISINTTSDSIYVGSKNVAIPQQFKSYWGRIYSDKKSIYKQDYPSLEVVKRADVKTPYLIINKDGEGYNSPLRMSVPVEVVGNKISLPNYFSYPYDYRFRNYRVDYELVIPSRMTVIKEHGNGVSFRGDINDDSDDTTDNMDFDYDNYSKGISIEKNRIKINGSTIEYNSNDENFIKINGKRYPIDSAENVLDRLKIDRNELKDLDINIKNGNNEVKVKASK